MDTTRTIAIYGAVLSTVALGWNVGRDVVNARRRIRLLLTDDSTVYIGDKVSHIMMQLRITNVSPTRDIEIVAVDFRVGRLAGTGQRRPAAFGQPIMTTHFRDS